MSAPPSPAPPEAPQASSLAKAAARERASVKAVLAALGIPRWATVVAACIIAVVFVPSLVLGVLSTLTLIPSDGTLLAARFPAYHERSDRKLPEGGCGLNEKSANGGCERIATAVETEEVSFPSAYPERGLERLVGTVYRPKGVAGRRGAMVLVHGSGPLCRELSLPGDLITVLDPPMPAFTLLAEELARQGIVVLTYDKRTCPSYDRSKFPKGKFEFSFFVDDAVDALRYMATREDVDPDALVVFGVSQGAQFAPFIARDHGHTAAVIALAGPTGKFSEALVTQVEHLAEHRAERGDHMSAVLIQLQADSWRECFTRMDTHPEEDCIGGASLRMVKNYDALVVNTIEVARGLTCPALFIQGNADFNVFPDQIDLLRDGLRGEDVELVRVDGLAHAMIDIRNDPVRQELHPELIKTIGGFLATLRPLPPAAP